MAPLLPKIAGEVIHKGKNLNKGTFNEGKEDLFNYTINLWVELRAFYYTLLFEINIKAL